MAHPDQRHPVAKIGNRRVEHLARSGIRLPAREHPGLGVVDLDESFAVNKLFKRYVLADQRRMKPHFRIAEIVVVLGYHALYRIAQHREACNQPRREETRRVWKVTSYRFDARALLRRSRV